ncbi:MAG: tRNA lysidine(34) synthetase TilS [Chloroflexota bacterium]
MLLIVCINLKGYQHSPTLRLKEIYPFTTMNIMSSKQTKPPEERVLHFMQQNHLVEAGELLLVAVSGGPDSTCLIHLLDKLKDKLGIRLHLAHLNHRLRGAESEADARFVVDLACQLGLPVTVASRDVSAYQKEKRLSPEEAAREVRYNFLAELGSKFGADRVAVGHTANDHLETILMHLIRGSGTRGLTGLRPKTTWRFRGNRINIIRPVFVLSRRETEEYCRSRNLAFRIDQTNFSLSPLRNRIRLELLPLLQSYNPEITTALMRTARIAGDDLAFIESETSRLKAEIMQKTENTVTLNREKLLALPASLQRSLLREAIDDLTGDVRNIEMVHIEDMQGLLDKGAGKTINLPRGLVFATEHERYILSKSEIVLSPLPPLESECPLKVPGETKIPGWCIVASIVSRKEIKDAFTGENKLVVYFDGDKIGEILMVRGRRRGDCFQPLGMDELKKVGEFMIDAKVPRRLRGNIPVVCSPRQIIWLVGLRMDERVKVTADTEKVLRLEFARD